MVPFLVAPRMNDVTHALVALIMTGMSFGFVHGLGLRAAHPPWRVVFSPWTAWPLMAGGWVALMTTSH